MSGGLKVKRYEHLAPGDRIPWGRDGDDRLEVLATPRMTNAGYVETKVLTASGRTLRLTTAAGSICEVTNVADDLPDGGEPG